MDSNEQRIRLTPQQRAPLFHLYSILHPIINELDYKLDILHHNTTHQQPTALQSPSSPIPESISLIGNITQLNISNDHSNANSPTSPRSGVNTLQQRRLSAHHSDSVVTGTPSTHKHSSRVPYPSSNASPSTQQSLQDVFVYDSMLHSDSFLSTPSSNGSSYHSISSGSTTTASTLTPTPTARRLPLTFSHTITMSTFKTSYTRRYEAVSFLKQKEAQLRLKLNLLSILQEIVHLALTRTHALFTLKIDKLNALYHTNTQVIDYYNEIIADTENYNNLCNNRLYKIHDARQALESAGSFQWSSPSHFYLASHEHFSGRFVRNGLFDVVNAMPQYLKLAAISHSQVLSILRIETLLALSTESLNLDKDFVSTLLSFQQKLKRSIDRSTKLHQDMLSHNFDLVTSVLNSKKEPNQLLLCYTGYYYHELLHHLALKMYDFVPYVVTALVDDVDVVKGDIEEKHQYLQQRQLLSNKLLEEKQQQQQQQQQKQLQLQQQEVVQTYSDDDDDGNVNNNDDDDDDDSYDHVHDLAHSNDDHHHNRQPNTLATSLSFTPDAFTPNQSSILLDTSPSNADSGFVSDSRNIPSPTTQQPPTSTAHHNKMVSSVSHDDISFLSSTQVSNSPSTPQEQHQDTNQPSTMNQSLSFSDSPHLIEPIGEKPTTIESIISTNATSLSIHHIYQVERRKLSKIAITLQAHSPSIRICTPHSLPIFNIYHNQYIYRERVPSKNATLSCSNDHCNAIDEDPFNTSDDSPDGCYINTNVALFFIQEELNKRCKTLPNYTKYQQYLKRLQLLPTNPSSGHNDHALTTPSLSPSPSQSSGYSGLAASLSPRSIASTCSDGSSQYPNDNTPTLPLIPGIGSCSSTNFYVDKSKYLCFVNNNRRIPQPAWNDYYRTIQRYFPHRKINLLHRRQKVLKKIQKSCLQPAVGQGKDDQSIAPSTSSTQRRKTRLSRYQQQQQQQQQQVDSPDAQIPANGSPTAPSHGNTFPASHTPPPSRSSSPHPSSSPTRNEGSPSLSNPAFAMKPPSLASLAISPPSTGKLSPSPSPRSLSPVVVVNGSSCNNGSIQPTTLQSDHPLVNPNSFSSTPSHGVPETEHGDPAVDAIDLSQPVHVDIQPPLDAFNITKSRKSSSVGGGSDTSDHPMNYSPFPSSPAISSSIPSTPIPSSPASPTSVWSETCSTISFDSTTTTHSNGSIPHHPVSPPDHSYVGGGSTTAHNNNTYNNNNNHNGDSNSNNTHDHRYTHHQSPPPSPTSMDSPTSSPNHLKQPTLKYAGQTSASLARIQNERERVLLEQFETFSTRYFYDRDHKAYLNLLRTVQGRPTLATKKEQFLALNELTATELFDDDDDDDGDDDDDNDEDGNQSGDQHNTHFDVSSAALECEVFPSAMKMFKDQHNDKQQQQQQQSQLSGSTPSTPPPPPRRDPLDYIPSTLPPAFSALQDPYQEYQQQMTNQLERINREYQRRQRLAQMKRHVATKQQFDLQSLSYHLNDDLPTDNPSQQQQPHVGTSEQSYTRGGALSRASSSFSSLSSPQYGSHDESDNDLYDTSSFHPSSTTTAGNAFSTPHITVPLHPAYGGGYNMPAHRTTPSSRASPRNVQYYPLKQPTTAMGQSKRSHATPSSRASIVTGGEESTTHGSNNQSNLQQQHEQQLGTSTSSPSPSPSPPPTTTLVSAPSASTSLTLNIPFALSSNQGGDYIITSTRDMLIKSESVNVHNITMYNNRLSASMSRHYRFQQQYYRYLTPNINQKTHFLQTQPKVCCAIQHALRERIYNQQQWLQKANQILNPRNPSISRRQKVSKMKRGGGSGSSDGSVASPITTPVIGGSGGIGGSSSSASDSDGPSSGLSLPAPGSIDTHLSMILSIDDASDHQPPSLAATTEENSDDERFPHSSSSCSNRPPFFDEFDNIGDITRDVPCISLPPSVISLGTKNLNLHKYYIDGINDVVKLGQRYHQDKQQLDDKYESDVISSCIGYFDMPKSDGKQENNHGSNNNNNNNILISGNNTNNTNTNNNSDSNTMTSPALINHESTTTTNDSKITSPLSSSSTLSAVSDCHDNRRGRSYSSHTHSTSSLSLATGDPSPSSNSLSPADGLLTSKSLGGSSMVANATCNNGCGNDDNGDAAFATSDDVKTSPTSPFIVTTPSQCSSSYTITKTCLPPQPSTSLSPGQYAQLTAICRRLDHQINEIDDTPRLCACCDEFISGNTFNFNEYMNNMDTQDEKRRNYVNLRLQEQQKQRQVQQQIEIANLSKMHRLEKDLFYLDECIRNLESNLINEPPYHYFLDISTMSTVRDHVDQHHNSQAPPSLTRHASSGYRQRLHDQQQAAKIASGHDVDPEDDSGITSTTTDEDGGLFLRSSNSFQPVLEGYRIKLNDEQVKQRILAEQEMTRLARLHLKRQQKQLRRQLREQQLALAHIASTDGCTSSEFESNTTVLTGSKDSKDDTIIAAGVSRKILDSNSVDPDGYIPPTTTTTHEDSGMPNPDISIIPLDDTNLLNLSSLLFNHNPQHPHLWPSDSSDTSPLSFPKSPPSPSKFKLDVEINQEVGFIKSLPIQPTLPPSTSVPTTINTWLMRLPLKPRIIRERVRPQRRITWKAREKDVLPPLFPPTTPPYGRSPSTSSPFSPSNSGGSGNGGDSEYALSIHPCIHSHPSLRHLYQLRQQIVDNMSSLLDPQPPSPGGHPSLSPNTTSPAQLAGGAVTGGAVTGGVHGGSPSRGAGGGCGDTPSGLSNALAMQDLKRPSPKPILKKPMVSGECSDHVVSQHATSGANTSFDPTYNKSDKTSIHPRQQQQPHNNKPTKPQALQPGQLPEPSTEIPQLHNFVYYLVSNLLYSEHRKKAEAQIKPIETHFAATPSSPSPSPSLSKTSSSSKPSLKASRTPSGSSSSASSTASKSSRSTTHTQSTTVSHVAADPVSSSLTSTTDTTAKINRSIQHFVETIIHPQATKRSTMTLMTIHTMCNERQEFLWSQLELLLNKREQLYTAIHDCEEFCDELLGFERC